MKKQTVLTSIFLAFILCACAQTPENATPLSVPVQTVTQETNVTEITDAESINTDDVQASSYAIWNEIPSYDGEPYIIFNDNIPAFTDNDKTTEPFESYSDLDELGRCGVAFANICQDIMPTEERGSIGHVKPSGWHTANYHELIDGNYLYNRCHLIGYQLAGENDNEKNLITGTRYLNVIGMLPFENQIADYVKNTNHHVLYRVSPVFYENELVCRGVLLEAQSIEDDDCIFCVYCFNVQPNIEIDYATGDSWIADTPSEQTSNVNDENAANEYILNTNSMKIHTPDCDSVQEMNPRNKKEYHGDIQSLLDQGYDTCKRCNPH